MRDELRNKRYAAAGIIVAPLLLSGIYFNCCGYKWVRDSLKKGVTREAIERDMKNIQGPPIEFITRPGRELAYYLNEADVKKNER